ncbi:MAG: hypothetical protein H8E60_05540 [Candidatus Marinimicrobia bacterium]|nr:hypothetical protein [Candidatus Neomarinimicrobiota bacterium]
MILTYIKLLCMETKKILFIGHISCTGCTNSEACNYDSLASIDDGSCISKQTYYLDADGDGYGCPSTEIQLCWDNPAVSNGTYVSEIGIETEENCLCDGAIDDCGVCNGSNTCYGCTDPDAVNYNANYTIDDGNCIYANDIINTFVDEALVAQQGNTSTTNLGGTPVAIFTHQSGYEYESADDFNVDLETYYTDGSLDDWLVANITDQSEADAYLNDFLEQYGGTDLGGFIYNINGPFSSSGGIQNYYLISYPLQETIQIHQLQDYFSITFETQPSSDVINADYGLADILLFSNSDSTVRARFQCEYNICSDDPTIPCGAFDICGMLGIGSCITLDNLSAELLPNCWIVQDFNSNEIIENFEIQQGTAFRFLPAATSQREESGNYGQFNFTDV